MGIFYRYQTSRNNNPKGIELKITNVTLDNFKAGLYDLLLLDIKMPEMNGFQLHLEVKKTDNTVKICFLTAGEERFRKEKEFCALDKELFLQKHIGNTELIYELSKLLEI